MQLSEIGKRVFVVDDKTRVFDERKSLGHWSMQILDSKRGSELAIADNAQDVLALLKMGLIEFSREEI